MGVANGRLELCNGMLVCPMHPIGSGIAALVTVMFPVGMIPNKVIAALRLRVPIWAADFPVSQVSIWMNMCLPQHREKCFCCLQRPV